MGLDISVFKDVKFIEGGELIDTQDEYSVVDINGVKYEEEQFYHIYLNTHFPIQSEGFSEFILLDENDKWRDYGFRAGSYGGYNQWRRNLAKIAGYQEDGMECDEAAWQCEFGPFIELIHFSDCEGAINSKISKKLLADFELYEEQAKKEDEWFYKIYQNFKEAFEIAGNKNGVVIFC